MAPYKLLRVLRCMFPVRFAADGAGLATSGYVTPRHNVTPCNIIHVVFNATIYVDDATNSITLNACCYNFSNGVMLGKSLWPRLGKSRYLRTSYSCQ